jgi:hypothetical protein
MGPNPVRLQGPAGPPSMERSQSRQTFTRHPREAWQGNRHGGVQGSSGSHSQPPFSCRQRRQGISSSCGLRTGAYLSYYKVSCSLSDISGKKIPAQKNAACEFTMQVVQDLTAMSDALGGPLQADKSDAVTMQCWKDLEPFW